jgi:hypothetical protein
MLSHLAVGQPVANAVQNFLFAWSKGLRQR